MDRTLNGCHSLIFSTLQWTLIHNWVTLKAQLSARFLGRRRCQIDLLGFNNWCQLHFCSGLTDRQIRQQTYHRTSSPLIILVSILNEGWICKRPQKTVGSHKWASYILERTRATHWSLGFAPRVLSFGKIGSWVSPAMATYASRDRASNLRSISTISQYKSSTRIQ